MSSSQKRIAGALLAGAALIAGALLIRSYTSEGDSATQDVAVVTQAPERTPIKTLDKNNDGVPDWQEALLVTEAIQISETTSEYEEPDTLTEQFALEFFQDMVRAENYGAFGATPEELVFDASNRLSKEAVDVLLTVDDIFISSDDSLEAQTLYGEMIAMIIDKYSQDNAENEAKILERALRNQDGTELEALDPVINVYTNYITDTKNLEVPPSLQKEHLDLLNSYKAILEDIHAMRGAFTDPMYTLLRMKRYQDDAAGMGISVINIYTKLIENGVKWDKNSIVFTLIEPNSNNQ